MILPAVRLTMEAVPAVMASTWEWISCLDSSILFLRQAWDALNKEKKSSGHMYDGNQSTWVQNKEVQSHSVCSQWGESIKVIQRGLCSLDSLHTGVDGSSEGLLSWSLWTQKKTLSQIWPAVLKWIPFLCSHINSSISGLIVNKSSEKTQNNHALLSSVFSGFPILSVAHRPKLTGSYWRCKYIVSSWWSNFLKQLLM